jgi:hypothetical protein
MTAQHEVAERKVVRYVDTVPATSERLADEEVDVARSSG